MPKKPIKQPGAPAVVLRRKVRAQLNRARNNLLTAVAIIREARMGGEIFEAKIRLYCDEALRAIAEVETLRSNAGTQRPLADSDAGRKGNRE